MVCPGVCRRVWARVDLWISPGRLAVWAGRARLVHGGCTSLVVGQALKLDCPLEISAIFPKTRTPGPPFGVLPEFRLNTLRLNLALNGSHYPVIIRFHLLCIGM